MGWEWARRRLRGRTHLDEPALRFQIPDEAAPDARFAGHRELYRTIVAVCDVARKAALLPRALTVALLVWLRNIIFT